jgi:hypothetical protein
LSNDYSIVITFMLWCFDYLIMSTLDNELLDMPKVTVKIEASTRDRLAKLGAKGDTFDTIIVRLMDDQHKTR